jgi:hypothetical protein
VRPLRVISKGYGSRGGFLLEEWMEFTGKRTGRFLPPLTAGTAPLFIFNNLLTLTP